MKVLQLCSLLSDIIYSIVDDWSVSVTYRTFSWQPLQSEDRGGDREM